MHCMIFPSLVEGMLNIVNIDSNQQGLIIDMPNDKKILPSKYMLFCIYKLLQFNLYTYRLGQARHHLIQ